MKYCSRIFWVFFFSFFLISIRWAGRFVVSRLCVTLSSMNECLHYYRSATKQRNIFCKMPTTNGTRIYRYRRTHRDYNLAFDKRMRGHRAMVFACVDYTATPINHNKTLTQYFHRLHPNRPERAPPCDSICPKCYRIMFPSVYCTATRPVWIAFFAAPPTKWLLLIAPVSKMVISV